jgi:hypothetical protein
MIFRKTWVLEWIGFGFSPLPSVVASSPVIDWWIYRVRMKDLLQAREKHEFYKRSFLITE